MRFLVDTHVWLWLQAEPSRVSPDVLDRLVHAEQLLLSAASTWEIGVKTKLGRLQLPEPSTSYIPRRMSASGTDALAVEIPHTLEAAALPMHHRDPFDRLLIAQSRLLNVPLVTADRAISDYDVDVIWA